MRNEDRQLAIVRRDAALARASRARRGLIIGTTAVSAAAAGLISTSPPGKAQAASSRVRTGRAIAHASTRATAPALPPLASPSALGLQAPGQPPAPAQDPSAPSAAPSPQASSDPSAQAPAPAPAPAPVSGGS